LQCIPAPLYGAQGIFLHFCGCGAVRFQLSADDVFDRNGGLMMHIFMPRWLAIMTAAIIIMLVSACWWQSLKIRGDRYFEAGREVERMQNPVKQYVEDGIPYVWYKGTFYRVQYVAPKTFRAVM
jgi:hypothetical protein